MEFVQGAKSLPVLHWCRALPWACPRCGLARPPPPTAGRVQAGVALGVSTVCVLRPWAPGGPCAGTSAQRGLQRARRDSCPRVPPTPWAADRGDVPALERGRLVSRGSCLYESTRPNCIFLDHRIVKKCFCVLASRDPRARRVSVCGGPRGTVAGHGCARGHIGPGVGPSAEPASPAHLLPGPQPRWGRAGCCLWASCPCHAEAM